MHAPSRRRVNICELSLICITALQTNLREDSHLLLFARRKLGKTLSLPKTQLSIVVAFIIFFPASTRAQSPRDYMNTPVDAGVLQVDLKEANTETVSASDLPLPNNVAVNRSGALPFTRTSNTLR